MNAIDRRIAERDVVLGSLVAGDRWAAAALARGDDLALLRRIAKSAAIADACELAVERAFMRGYGHVELQRALRIPLSEVHLLVKGIYSRLDPSDPRGQ